MINLEKMYNRSFFCRREKNLSWRACYVCQALINTFKLRKRDSIVDIGCAVGEYVKWFNDNGFLSKGLEGSKEVKDFVMDNYNIIYGIDVRKPLDIFTKFDLCISFEVAEHIEEEFSDEYVSNLKSLSDNVIISAAPPGQDGHGHINCQPKKYWIEKFNKFDYSRCLETEIIFKKSLEQMNVHKLKSLRSYYLNCLVFKK